MQSSPTMLCAARGSNIYCNNSVLKYGDILNGASPVLAVAVPLNLCFHTDDLNGFNFEL